MSSYLENLLASLGSTGTYPYPLTTTGPYAYGTSLLHPSTAQAEKERLQRELDAVSGKVGELEEELLARREELTMVSAERDALRERCAEERGRVAIAENAFRTERDSHERTIRQLETSQQAVIDVNIRIGTALRERDAYRADMEARGTSLQDQLDRNQAGLKQALSEVTALQADALRRETEGANNVKRLKDEVKSLEETMLVQAHENGQLVMQVAEAKVKEAHSLATRHSNVAEIKRLQALDEQRREQIQRLEQQIEALKAEGTRQAEAGRQDREETGRLRDMMTPKEEPDSVPSVSS